RALCQSGCDRRRRAAHYLPVLSALDLRPYEEAGRLHALSGRDDPAEGGHARAVTPEREPVPCRLPLATLPPGALPGSATQESRCCSSSPAAFSSPFRRSSSSR